MELYKQQLDYVFNRPVTKPAWYWQPQEEEENPFGNEEDSTIAFLFFEALFRQPGIDLAAYSDAQIGLGLDYLFNSSASNLAHGFKAAAVPQKRKIAALQALFTLFQEVMEPRCLPVLSAGEQETFSPLNNICYMFWDVTPWSDWLQYKNEEQISMSFLAEWSNEDYADMNLPKDVAELMQKWQQEQLAQMQISIKTPEEIGEDIIGQYQNMDEDTKAYYHAIAGVMGRCLELHNPACIESGLHGLGHLATFQRDLAVPVIDNFLKTHKKQDTRLLNYAKAARTGMIL